MSQTLTTMETLQESFGADIEWDEAGLTLRFSPRANLFDTRQFSGYIPVLSKNTAPSGLPGCGFNSGKSCLAIQSRTTAGRRAAAPTPPTLCSWPIWRAARFARP